MRKQLWIVKLMSNNLVTKNESLDGFLAHKGIQKRIAAYPRGEAIKKARLYNGKIRKLETFGH